MNNQTMLRRIRSHPALFGELGLAKEKQAIRIRDKCKARLAPVWKERVELLEHLRGQRMLQTWA